jgi:hypothetical protein
MFCLECSPFILISRAQESCRSYKHPVPSPLKYICPCTQEVICPLFVWTKGHHKRGSRDVLVLEERILLLLTTYAPNLWRVFLTYAHDAVGKVSVVWWCAGKACRLR